MNELMNQLFLLDF